MRLSLGDEVGRRAERTGEPRQRMRTRGVCRQNRQVRPARWWLVVSGCLAIIAVAWWGGAWPGVGSGEQHASVRIVEGDPAGIRADELGDEAVQGCLEGHPLPGRPGPGFRAVLG